MSKGHTSRGWVSVQCRGSADDRDGYGTSGKNSKVLPVRVCFVIAGSDVKQVQSCVESRKSHASSDKSLFGCRGACERSRRPCVFTSQSLGPVATGSRFRSCGLACKSPRSPDDVLLPALLVGRWPDPMALFGRGEKLDSCDCSFVQRNQCGFTGCW